MKYLNSQGNTMPEPKSMLEVTIEANNLVSLASAKELYLASMESLCGGEKYDSMKRRECFYECESDLQAIH